MRNLSDNSFSKQWRLARVEVVNWGTFDGFHGVDVARKGHLFTGPSGSGKSSLLDAITAALTPKRGITFNAAAQESTGKRVDRTWVSYVRGAWAKEADELEDRTISSYLRKRATWSGILLRFEREGDNPISLYRLFHLRGSSNAASDLKELSFITRTSQGLLDFDSYIEGGPQAKRLKAEQKPVVVATGSKPGPYFNRLRRLLGIRNETALLLLHRTQAAKNFGTLDTLFRKFMLDEPKTFQMAQKAVEEFGELREAHSHVVDLGRQKEALLLVQEAASQFESAQASTTRIETLSNAVIPYANQLKLESARKALSSAKGEVARVGSSLTRIMERVQEAQDKLDIAHRRVLELGGGDQRNLQARIADGEKQLAEVEKRREILFARMDKAGLPAPESEADYSQIVDTAGRILTEDPPEGVSHEQYDLLAQARRQKQDLEQELESLNRNRSSIPSRLLAVRDGLGEKLSIPKGLLPFAGELLAVRPEYQAWTGAIERALKSLSTTLLVRDQDLRVVREAVNKAHLGVNLTIDAVPQQVASPAPVEDQRSLVYRVQVIEGPFSAYLSHQLSTRFDLACVDSPDELDHLQRGLTIEGLIKRSKSRYVKADRSRVDDKTKWVLGGALEVKRRVLEEQLEQARKVLQDRYTEVTRTETQRKKELEQRHMLGELLHKPWSEIDAEAVIVHIQGLREQRAELVKPESELGQAAEAETQATDRLKDLREQENQTRGQLALAENEQANLETAIQELEEKDATDLPEAVRNALGDLFRKQRRAIRYDEVHEVAATIQDQLRGQLSTFQRQTQQASAQFSQLAASFANIWPAVTTNADLTAQVEDRRGYIDLLDDIVARGLPEHEENFRRLLNERSRESVAFLLDDLMRAPNQIAQRIEPINASLAISPFDKSVYLNISTKVSRTEEVRSFLGELRAIVDDSWSDQEFKQAETRFQKLAAIMEKFSSTDRTDREWRARVLDSREHVTFVAKEVDLEGKVVDVHDSSVGLSGGQRQKLVVFCLAAALRYQLGDPDTEIPQYATVILDEAFDKADSTYTRVAMDVFNTFGFHMVLATPQKLLQTLEPYLGGITVVTNPSRQASGLASLEF